MTETVAAYSMKGGVGQTTLAVNLAWCAAVISALRTVLWDIDAQGAASFLCAHERADSQGSRLRRQDHAPAP